MRKFQSSRAIFSCQSYVMRRLHDAIQLVAGYVADLYLTRLGSGEFGTAVGSRILVFCSFPISYLLSLSEHPSLTPPPFLPPMICNSHLAMWARTEPFYANGGVDSSASLPKVAQPKTWPSLSPTFSSTSKLVGHPPRTWSRVSPRQTQNAA